MHIDLPVIWAAIIGLGVFIYVMLDGFDLGIGLLFPFFDAKAERQVMLDTVAPVWDGNETFLVLGGAGLYGAFPVVYSTLLPANYLPLVLMLVGLIFRGAAFELRAKATRTQHMWDLAFIGGSALAAFCQGSCSVRCCRASRSRTTSSRAGRSTGCRRSACCAGSACSSRMRRSAAAG